MASEYWEEKQAGFKEALAAWAILFVVMTALQALHLLWQVDAPPATTKTVDFQR
jgi:hypothetical protein